MFSHSPAAARPAKFPRIMAWHIDEPLIRGEIDNRTRGRVTGRLWFLGRADPVVLELSGNAWRDVAGHVLRFTNPVPQPGRPDLLKGLATEQRGVVGDITASRKVKVPECSMDELMALYVARKPFPWHWGNSLYLEWHSERNGRVVIESAGYQIEIDPEAAWTMTEAEEAAQQEANGHAMVAFMERLAGAMKAADRAEEESPPGDKAEEDDEGVDADAPTSKGEAAADAEQARMDLLLDRVQARIARAQDAGEEPDFERILEEERIRLRRERGEPEPTPPTPEEEAERAEWIAEINAAAEEAAREIEADKWKKSDGDDLDDEQWHPLVERCNALTKRLLDETRTRGWLADSPSPEHPLREVVNGVMIAGGKLAGALGTTDDADEWPPEALFAGSVLTRLKKARGHLRDALAGLDAADEQDLAEPSWRTEIRREATAILGEVESLVAEVRAILAAADEEETPDEADDAP